MPNNRGTKDNSKEDDEDKGSDLDDSISLSMNQSNKIDLRMIKRIENNI